MSPIIDTEVQNLQSYNQAPEKLRTVVDKKSITIYTIKLIFLF